MKKYSILLIVCIFIIISAGIFLIFGKKQKNENLNSQSNQPFVAEESSREYSDNTVGIKFAVTNDFVEVQKIEENSRITHFNSVNPDEFSFFVEVPLVTLEPKIYDSKEEYLIRISNLITRSVSYTQGDIKTQFIYFNHTTFGRSALIFTDKVDSKYFGKPSSPFKVANSVVFDSGLITGDVDLDVSKWNTYRSDKSYPYNDSDFKLKFKYPTLGEIDHALEPAISVEPIHFMVYHLFKEILVGNSGMKLEDITLESYARRIWELNVEDIEARKQRGNIIKRDKLVSDFKSVIVHGYKGYEFNLNATYHDNDGGYSFDEERTFIFLAHPTNKHQYYMISYPVANKQIAEKILETVELVE